jgi:hypothetical protein
VTSERRFNGWPTAAIDVLLQLEGEPSSPTRERLRHDREHLVRRPMLDLLTDVAAADEAYERFSVWGYGKTAWWWQHQCGIVRIERSVELNVRFDLDGLWIGGGWGWATSSQVERYRRAVDDEGSGAELVEIVDTLRGLGFEVTGTTLQRVPRAYARDHPRGDLLRHRSLTATRLIDDEAILHSSAATESVLETYDLIRPLISWEIDHASGA